ncbi:MAG: ATP-binding protein [Balneolales bacterium]|nr:ATP-binding protein [Balneolales bacterium]
MDYSRIISTPAEPEASSMIETFRAIGYSIETAVADIIDNSISARAKNIWVDYKWDGSGSIISVSDDGLGMNNEELIQAMRPGSRHPLEQRNEDDLGRFGLGLKTASFSQCRKFTVISRKAGYSEVYWTWDLDYVNESRVWNLLKYKPFDETYCDQLHDVETGTTVVWADIDRLTQGISAENEESKMVFLKVMDKVRNHLSMVFHRYISSGITIWFRGRKIPAWDPFMIGSDGLQARPKTELENKLVRIKGFVLPHRSKLTPAQYNYAKGPEQSWTAHQGFYIYRNRRLLVAGDWLGMFKKEPHYDLCRIQVDLSNSLDNEWQIDIKKSLARPPARLKQIIKNVASDVRTVAVEVYRHKGKVVKRQFSQTAFSPVWIEKTRHGKRFYKINRDHPILKSLLQNFGASRIKLEKAFEFIEETVPVPLISLHENENEIQHSQPFENKNHDPFIEIMKQMYITCLSEGLTSDQAKSRIANIEPFNFYLEYLDQLDGND